MAEPTPLLQQAQMLWRELPGLVGDRVDLLALELQRAGRALGIMLMLVAAAALLGVTAWGLLWALIVSLLLQAGLALWAALALSLTASVVAAGLALWGIKPLLPRLGMHATRRHFGLTPSPRPPADPGNTPPKPNTGPEHANPVTR